MIYLASDHAGFRLKDEIRKLLDELNIEFKDMGPVEYDEQDDYPDYIFPAAEEVANDPDNNLGIFLGGSGQGEAIAANKIKGIRAGVYYGGSRDILFLMKTHNKANVLSLGARFISEIEAMEAVKLWLGTSFSGETRHSRRIEKIASREK